MLFLGHQVVSCVIIIPLWLGKIDLDLFYLVTGNFFCIKVKMFDFTFTCCFYLHPQPKIKFVWPEIQKLLISLSHLRNKRKATCCITIYLQCCRGVCPLRPHLSIHHKSHIATNLRQSWVEAKTSSRGKACDHGEPGFTSSIIVIAFTLFHLHY